MTSHDDQQRPRDWKMFRGELTRRVERVSGRTDELFYESAEKYIKALLTAMSRGKDMASMELFKRAFRFSLRLRYDKSVDEIIRQEVLEARPTNIRVFMEVTATFRHLRQLVEGVKKQLVAGEEIARAYVDADKQHQRMGAWQILAEDVEAACAAEAAARATQAKEVAAEAAKTAANAALEARKHLGNLRAERDRLVERRDGHDAHSRLAPLQGHIDRDHREIQVVRGHMQARLTELDATLRFAAGAPFLANFSDLWIRRPRTWAVAKHLTLPRGAGALMLPCSGLIRSAERP